MKKNIIFLLMSLFFAVIQQAFAHSPIPSQLDTVKVCKGSDKELAPTLKPEEDESKLSFEWQHPDGHKSSEQKILLKSIQTEETHYLTIKDRATGNAIRSIGFFIQLMELPEMTTPQSIVDKDGKITLFTVGNLPGLEYTWFGPNAKKPELQGAIVTIADASIQDIGNYLLQVRDSKSGCKTSKSLNVQLSKSEPITTPAKEVFGTFIDDEDQVTYNYVFDRIAPIKVCDVYGNEDLEHPYLIAPIKSKFVVIQENDENIILQFWLWPKESESKSKTQEAPKINDKVASKRLELNQKRYIYNFTDTTEAVKKFFLLSRSYFSTRTSPYHSTWRRNISFTAGTILIPVKLRFNDFEFAKDVTIGPFAGARVRMHHFKPNYLSVGMSAGISSVTLSKINSVADRTMDIAAFTYSFGLVAEFNKVQIGGFIGSDLINGNKTVGETLGYSWKYQGETWLSIGLGFSILNRPGKEQKTKAEENK